MKHKVIVIGAGYFGQRHIKMLAQMEDVEIVAIVDKDIKKARKIAREYGVKFSDNFKDLLKEASVFFIVTPTKSHFEIAIDLIKEGKDIFIEKPITENYEHATVIIEEALKNKIIFQVGLIERYNPVVVSLFEQLKTPLFIKAERTSPYLGRATDTDVTFDLMIHDLDLIMMFQRKIGKGNFNNIKVFKKSLITEKIDFATVLLEILINNSPFTAQITASRTSPIFQRNITIIDEEFIIYADLINKNIIKIDKKGTKNEIPIENRENQPLYEEIRDFLNSVSKREFSQKAPTPEEILEVIKLINKINGGSS
jgi:predicted dehydrogenase